MDRAKNWVMSLPSQHRKLLDDCSVRCFVDKVQMMDDPLYYFVRDNYEFTGSLIMEYALERLCSTDAKLKRSLRETFNLGRSGPYDVYETEEEVCRPMLCC